MRRGRMDYLRIEVSPAEVTGHKHAAVGLYTVARINGRALPDILDVDAFFDALTGRGRLPLFTSRVATSGAAARTST